MPGFDKTGPTGQGAQTGRKMGRCKTENETSTDELATSGGRGLGRGMGRRLRMRNGGNSPGQRRGLGRRQGGKN